MKPLISLFLFLLLFFSGKAQPDIKRIDSLVNIIETNKELLIKNRCDTTGSETINESHVDYWVRFCDSYYYSNKQVSKIVIDSERSPWEKIQFDDTISVQIFYFHNGALIKSIQKDLHNPVKIVDQYYFTENDLTGLKTIFGEGNAKDKRIASQISFANELLDTFKKIVER